MAGIIGAGSDGLAVTPYDSWLDARCSAYLGLMQDRASDLILKRAGTAPSINHGPKKLWWKHERPEVYSKIEKFVQPGSYAAMRLCGLSGDEGFIDRTYLHFSGFADTEKGVWDEERCSLFDIDMKKLPHIYDSVRIVGKVTKEAASSCGLLEGTPVAAGCGDTVASFLSTGAVKKGICVDVAGTASVFAATHDRFSPDLKHRILGCCASGDGLYYSYAYINGGGMVQNGFEAHLILPCIRVREMSRDQQDGRYFKLPPVLPHMAGRVMPGRPNLRGSFSGLSWNHEKSHLFRRSLRGSP